MLSIKSKCVGIKSSDRPVFLRIPSLNTLTLPSSSTLIVRGDSCGVVSYFRLRKNLIEVVWSISLQKRIGCLTTADGNQIAATFGTEIALIDLINGKVLCSFDTSLTACIKQLHFDPKLSEFHTANEAVYVGLNSEGKEIGSYQSADKITDFINIPTSTKISIAAIAFENRRIVITYNFNPVHEIHAFHRPTALLFSNISDVTSLLLYGTDSGTWHAIKLDLQRDSIIHTNLFDVENESKAAITVLEEFMRNDDHGVMIGRDDGTVEIYNFPDFEVDSIQIPSLLLKKHVEERILSFIGWADDVSSDGALDTLLVSVFSGHIYAITMLPHGSTEMNSKELIQILQRAKEETTVIENQNLKSQKQRKGLPPVPQSKPKSRVMSRLKSNLDYSSFTLQIESTDSIGMISINSDFSLNLKCQDQEKLGIFSSIDRRDKLPAESVSFVFTQKQTRAALSVYPIERKIVSVLCTVVLGNGECVQSRHTLPPFCLHQRTQDAVDAERLLCSMTMVAEASSATLHHWIHLLFPDVPETIPSSPSQQLIYHFRNTKTHSFIQVNLDRSTLHIQTSTLTSLHIIHTQLTSLAAKYQTKTTVSTRLNFPHSINAHLGLLLPVLERWKNQKNEQMLLEGLKAVDDFDSGFRDVVDDGWLQLLKGGIQGESILKEEEVDMAQQELEKLFISSYALKGVSVEKKRSWFVGKVKEVIESGLSVDVLKKLFHNDGLS